MKRFFRGAAAMLILLQLFTVTAAADAEVSASVIEKMIAAASGTAVTSGAAAGTAAASTAKAAANSASTKAEDGTSDKDSADDEKDKKEEEYIPVTKVGSEGDVMIGGLEVHPGVWYTVIDGELTSAPPWPDSYLYYSASQSKITLHEFHYTVTADRTGTDDTFAALYIPKDMHIVLEGENELVNRSYSKAGGGTSNGIYARDCALTFEGDGTLDINTRSEEGMSGYGIAAGRIRIEKEFVGLRIYGRTAAFSVAPSVKESRHMVAQRGDLHPNYHADVVVRDANPYDRNLFTGNRYVLFAAGKELSAQDQMRVRVEAEMYATRADYEEARDNAYEQSVLEFSQAVDQEIDALIAGTEEWQSEISAIPYAEWEEGSIGSQLAQMMNGIG